MMISPFPVSLPLHTEKVHKMRGKRMRACRRKFYLEGKSDDVQGEVPSWERNLYYGGGQTMMTTALGNEMELHWQYQLQNYYHHNLSALEKLHYCQ